MKLSLMWSVALATSLISINVYAKDIDLTKASELFKSGAYKKAALEISKIKKQTKNLSAEQAELIQVGELAYKFYSGVSVTKEAQALLQAPHRFAPYIKYILGQSLEESSQYDEALKIYEDLVAQKGIPYQLRNDSNYKLSQIYLNLKQYKKARKKLLVLQRKWRGSFKRQPEVLWSLVYLELEAKRKWKACKWARKLYSKYPMHDLVADWGIDLQKVKIESKELGCVASHDDQRGRIKKLQWAGLSSKALAEISELLERVKEEDRYDIESLYARYLLHEGDVNAAVSLLLKHYKSQEKNYKYLMLLAKATSRAGEFQTAVGAYYKVSKLQPTTRTGRKALYFSAFLSYQFQDYDGATRKFEEFIKRYKRSGLSRDAKYNLSWIKYLKGNYAESANGFKSILAQKERNARKWRKYPVARLKYWMAMSHMRLGQYDQAAPVFFELMKNPFVDYYAVASRHRYNTIPGVQKITRKMLSTHRDVASVRNILEKANPDRPHFLGEDKPSLENESEENMVITAQDEGEAADEVLTPEQEQRLQAKAEKISLHFSRAESLSLLGLSDWSRWEMRRIEYLAKSADDFKRLAALYESESTFHRSSRIGEFKFSEDRERVGLWGGAEKYWQMTYPRAFKKVVSKNSEKFGVESSYIWAIMRSESHYKADIMSPVGAKGLMQVMPHSGLQISKLLGDSVFNPKSLDRPEVNVRLGTKYLSRLLAKFSGSIPLASAGYNAGPHRVHNWLAHFGHLDMDEFVEHIPFIETRKYVKKVTRYYNMYNLIYGKTGTETSLAWLPAPVAHKIGRAPAKFREDWSPLKTKTQ